MSFYTGSCTYNGIEFSGNVTDILPKSPEEEVLEDSLKTANRIFFKKTKKKNGGDYGQK